MRKRNLSWITPAILRAIRKRNSLLKKSKHRSNPTILSLYKAARNRICSELKKAKQAFFKKLHIADVKTFWKLYKTLTNKGASIPVLHVPNSGDVSNDLDKANILNNQFYSNFNHTPANTPPSSIANQLDPSDYPENMLCSEEQVLSLISSLDTTKSTGSDGVSARMLKATAISIARSVTDLFNLSLRTGKIPTQWKLARITPIPKGGKPEDPTNYRPISILTILSKLLEKHLHDLLSDHLAATSPLSDSQWGFSNGKSTTSALISFTHDCQEALDRGDEICSIFFDLSKAFDTVPHHQLLQKLTDLQVNPFIIKWIKDYLTGRSQAVALNGAQSTPLPVVSGVPQGSVLGPLLFLVYIDGVCSSVTSSKITIYADDIAIYKNIRTQSDYTALQRDVTSVCDWIDNNYLKLNLDKCCYLIFSKKRHPTSPDVPLVVGDSHALNERDNFRYLGVNFSSNLTWSYHTNIICNKSRKLVGLLYRNFYKFASPFTLGKLHKSLIRPHMEYASPVWDPFLAKDIKAIEDVQKFALRVCTKSWRSDYNELLDYCDIPTMASRRKVAKLCLLFNILFDNKT